MQDESVLEGVSDDAKVLAAFLPPDVASIGNGRLRTQSGLDEERTEF